MERASSQPEVSGVSGPYEDHLFCSLQGRHPRRNEYTVRYILRADNRLWEPAHPSQAVHLAPLVIQLSRQFLGLQGFILDAGHACYVNSKTEDL